MTIKEVNESWPTLLLLMARKGIPQEITFKIARQAQKLKADIELYQKMRSELIRKYGELAAAERNEQGEVTKQGGWLVKAEHEEIFIKEDEAMSNQEIKVKIETIKKEDIPKKVNLEAMFYYHLGWLIK